MKWEEIDPPKQCRRWLKNIEKLAFDKLKNSDFWKSAEILRKWYFYFNNTSETIIKLIFHQYYKLV